MTTKRAVIAVMNVLGCLAIGVSAYAQGGDVVSQIKQLQEESTKAQMNNDVSWAQEHLADGFIAGHSWGQWQNKDEFIKELQDKKNKWKSGNISDVNVATFGANTAVAHYRFTYDADIGGTHRARSVIC
ncbi:MAG: nuclear transport factor 2 family protein, partial [Acidobacteria bacterium]|nr:nuclear transport factor 2 family protein [Acidobacteriota bacterium]